MDGFVHLHVHSHYSLLDGASRVESLVETAKKQGATHMALTDHGNLFGAMNFYDSATSAGLKPILGMEAYISPTTRDDRSMGNIQTAAYHLLLLAMNETGWRNLMRLSSRAYLEGFYYRPRVDRELLAEFSEGLICSSACLSGEIPRALLSGQAAHARKVAGEYLEIFGKERFFVEVQNQGVEDQTAVNGPLMKLAGELGVGVVGTNDVHFLRRTDKPAHEVLTCISTGKTLSEGGAMHYPPELYLKSPAEMREALKDLPGAADATLRIAEMCDVTLDFSQAHLPTFKPPGGKTADEHLREVAFAALDERLGSDVPQEYVDRMERELQVIKDKNYSSYVLIVHDFVEYAVRNNIPCGARGSGCATLLGYCLDISNVDPIRYGLLFERFTDPQRDEAPDFDIDICQDGRGKVLQYVREKYGHVAQIITYGTLKARAVVRDVGRVMGVPLPEVDAIAKKVPDGLKVTLASALETDPDFRALYDGDQTTRQLIDYGMSLEGLARHAGVHAAGVIVADEPLETLVPLCKQSDSDDAITQWDGPTCDKVGLMKMDFLGLRTLTTLQRARELAEAATGKDFNPEKLPLDDPKVFELFCRGATDGVFQFESDGMKNVLMQMQPARIEDLIAANAMYRPGPMELIPTYCARKSGRENVPSVHKLVDDILAETYGIMCYQEQVMLVLNKLGQLPLNRALTLIKAISKKKEKVIASERPNFLEGAKANGISEAEAAELFDLILRFAGYGFNKAHSTRYAILAYQTAYFKVYHPREFLAALLTFECGDTDKVVQYMAEAERMKVPVSPPDINTCGADFTVDGDHVRFGMAAVKGVGGKAIEAIKAARQEVGRFTDLYHFCEYVDLRAVNRSTTEALIKCGAFDALGASRAAMTAALDQAISLGQAAAADRRSGQMNMFGEMLGDQKTAPRFPDVEPWSEAELLKAEKDTLGFYVTSHPLVRYGRVLESLAQPDNINLARLGERPDRSPIVIGCMIAGIRPTVTKKSGRRMAMLTVEDLTTKSDAVVFPDAFDRFGELLQSQAIVFLRGNVDRSRERPNIIVDEIIPVDTAIETLPAAIRLSLPTGGARQEVLGPLKELLKQHHGNCPVDLELQPDARTDVRAVIRASQEWSVQPTGKLLKALSDLLEENNVRLTPKLMPVNGNGNGRGFYRRKNGNGQHNGTSSAGNGPASPAVTRFN